MPVALLVTTAPSTHGSMGEDLQKEKTEPEELKDGRYTYAVGAKSSTRTSTGH